MISNTSYFQNIQLALLNELDKTDNSIALAISWLTDKVLFHKLYSLCKKGKKVEILLNYDNINLSSNIDYEIITKSGGKIYWEYPDINQLMHNKYCIIDNCTIINGSYNWTNNAKNNNENIIVIKNDFELIKQFENEFYRLTNQKHRINQETFSFPVEYKSPVPTYELFLNWWKSIGIILKIVLTERILMKNYDFNSLPDISDYELINTCTNIDLEWTGNLLLNYNEAIDNYNQALFLYVNKNGYDLNSLKGIEALTQLEYLNCSANDIIDFKPLSNLSNLIYLDLYDSGRTSKIFFNIEFDLNPLTNLKKLEYLNLSGNNKVVNYEALFSLINLKTLIIDKCGLSREEVEKLKIELPDCDIISTSEYNTEEEDSDDYPF